MTNYCSTRLLIGSRLITNHTCSKEAILGSKWLADFRTTLIQSNSWTNHSDRLFKPVQLIRLKKSTKKTSCTLERITEYLPQGNRTQWCLRLFIFNWIPDILFMLCLGLLSVWVGGRPPWYRKRHRSNRYMRKRGVVVLTVLPSCGNYPTLVKQRAAGAPDVSLLIPHNKRRGKDSSKNYIRREMFKT